MKKFFALALAAAMIASMSAVSLAATGTVATGSDGSPTIKSDEKKVFYPIVDAIGPFTYDADDKALNDDVVEYGDTAYFMLLQGNDGTSAAKANNGKTLASSYDIELVTESETVSSLKLKADWEEGKSLVKTVSVVKKKVCNNTTTATLTDDDGNLYPTMTTLLNKATGAINSYNEDEYYYFIAVATNSSTSTSDADIIGTLTVSKSSHPKVDDLDMDLAINVNWANSYLDSTKDWTLTGDSDPIEAGKYYAIKFDSSIDDEIDINFDDDSIFTVDCSGQSKLLVYFDTDYNSKIAAKYPLAELNFWNGNGAKFNRVGEMFLACDQDYEQYLYQINSDGTLSEVPGAEYDEYDGGFYFNTRVLGSYVISDMELELESTTPATTTPVVDTPVVTTPAPVVTNPSTGAAA